MRAAWCRVMTVGLLALAGDGLSPRQHVDAQVRPVYDRGAAGLGQALQRLRTTASVLHTGAHPDDEDSSFLARLARGDHARVAYLSLNRGEGGQNLIGTELFDALGVIRTEELLQARRLDGGEQFFTRSFDYGFSKTRAEAAALWPERAVLGDMVRVIRTFRPLVVYSRFSGTPADGHGQHQFAGYLTPIAFDAAADPAQFPEQIAEGLRPWQAKVLLRGTGPRSDGGAAVEVQTGTLDPLLGRTYAEIAFEGRSQHKSQKMGAVEPLGPNTSGVLVVRRAPGLAPAAGRDASIFGGIDVSLMGLAALAGLSPGTLGAELAAVDAAAAEALASYRPVAPEGIVPILARGLTAVRAARAAARTLPAGDAAAEAAFLLAIKEREFADALVRASGVVVDPLADAETVVPGSQLGVTVRTFIPEGAAVSVERAVLQVPTGWAPAAAATAPASGAPGGSPFGGRRETPTVSSRHVVTVPADAPPTQPYFLTTPRSGPSYDWPAGTPVTLPFGAPLLTADVTLAVAGVTLVVTRPVDYRFADPVRGELRRAVGVVPPVTVGLDSRLLVIPTGTTAREQRVVVRAASFSPTPVEGVLRLRLPDGWKSRPETVPLRLAESGDATSASFVVTVPPRRTAATLAIGAEAAVGGAVYAQDVQTIAYPHIQTHRLYEPATATVQVFDLAVAPVRVGYIMGSGDQVPEALQRMGLAVTLIDPDLLSTGDLSRFDTILVGIRASEVRPDFVANQGRLREFMERGGTLVVQYQQTDYPMRGLPPYPVQSPTNSRVTDEGAPVRILAPAHPVFTFPNRITAADFAGWVQERNLYAFGTFDARYVPLLESGDPGEAPAQGGEVYAEVGKGRYVYTAYAWFRQLPAGVPGAYRQFANLVSLARAPRR